ncbi:MAG: A24 family peptidase [archaeon]
MIELIPVLVALVATTICAYDDWRTSYLNDKLVYAFLAFSIAWVFLFSQDIASTFLIAGAVFGVGFVAYLFGQIGGGDVFLFTVLALLLPYYPSSFAPVAEFLGFSPVVGSPFPFVLSVFLLAGMLGPMLFYSSLYFIRIVRIRKKIKDFSKKIAKSLVYCAVLVPLFFFWHSFSSGMFLLFFPMATSFLILPFKDDVTRFFCLEKKKVSRINDDDVIALEFMSEKTKKKLGLWRRTLTKPEIKKFKALARKAKVTSVPVCEHLPKFVPFMLLSLVINLLLGDVILYLMFKVHF